MTLGPAFWALIGLGAAAAIAYGAIFLNRPPSWLRVAVKTLFLSCWAAAFALAQAHPVLILALAAAAAGDFFLAFDNRWLLPFGVIAFLVAQLGYIIIFFFSWMFAGDNEPLWPRYLLMTLIIASSFVFLLWMAPKLKWMALAVVPYAIAITGMSVAAMWIPWLGWPAMIGALSFLVSDLVLAAELFRLAPDAPARRFTAPVVWWTYAAAQALIVAGVVLLARANQT